MLNDDVDYRTPWPDLRPEMAKLRERFQSLAREFHDCEDIDKK